MSETYDETYEDAVRDGTVTELPLASAVAPPPREPDPAYDRILRRLVNRELRAQQAAAQQAPAPSRARRRPPRRRAHR